MYTIGEFARMAQVSKRQLRHWDELGLLQPEKVDPGSGYRYYSASQLSALNRIIALKELGLSLDQIQRFVRDDVSLDEMQGMLLLRKAEIEQQVLQELRRVRVIESRLDQIRKRGEHIRDVVVKHVPVQTYFGIRSIVPDWEATYQVWQPIISLLPAPNNNVYGNFLGILHADGVTTDYSISKPGDCCIPRPMRHWQSKMGKRLSCASYLQPRWQPSYIEGRPMRHILASVLSASGLRSITMPSQGRCAALSCNPKTSMISRAWSWRYNFRSRNAMPILARSI